MRAAMRKVSGPERQTRKLLKDIADMRDIDVQGLQDVQARIARLGHAFRQADKFEVSQHLSDAGEKVGKAIRALELSKQGTAENGEAEHG